MVVAEMLKIFGDVWSWKEEGEREVEGARNS
jgi:hypothetical protein